MEPIRAEDLFQLRYPSAPVLSPDGSRCAFLVHTALEQEDRYQSDLWLASTDGSGAQPLLCGRAPRFLLWQNEKTLLFTENAGGRSTCYAVDVSDGAVRPLVQLEQLCTGLWLLNETTLLGRAKYTAAVTNGVHVLKEIPFWANGQGFTGGQRSALFACDLTTGTCQPVGPQDGEIGVVSTTNGRVYYSVRYRLNRKMKFAAVRRYSLASGVDEELVGPDVYDVFWAGEVGGKARMLATDMQRYGNVENPWFYDISGAQPQVLADRDEAPTNDVTSDARYGSCSQYAVDGDLLYYIVTQNGCSQLACMDAQGSRRLLTDCQGTVDGVTAAAGCVCGVAARGTRSAEVYRFLPQGETALTDLNGEYFATHNVGAVRRWSFERAGTQIEGFALLPDGFDAGGRWPAVLQVHGGPKLAYGPVFHHEMQLMRAQGYVVLYCNPRGSDGRGNRFMDVRGRYGCEDYNDIMAFVDDALARWPQIDPARIGVCGGSYGGFMVNWIIGHTHRFACAVSQRSISNMLSMFCTSDIGYRFVADQCAATPWQDPETLWRQSPLAYAHNAKTPTLFIHGNEDYRCDRSEGMQMFTALRYHGVESRLCLFEGENHELSRGGTPTRRLRRLAEITAWLDRYLKPT